MADAALGVVEAPYAGEADNLDATIGVLVDGTEGRDPAAAAPAAGGAFVSRRRAQLPMAGSPVSSRACFRKGISAVPPVPVSFLVRSGCAAARAVEVARLRRCCCSCCLSGWVAGVPTAACAFDAEAEAVSRDCRMM